MNAQTVLRLLKRIEMGMRISQEEAQVLVVQGLVTRTRHDEVILTYEAKQFLEWQRNTTLKA